jgi:hypothetical protein
MEALPGIPFGSHTVSRLIVGANTINGGSHLSRFTNEQMKRYFSTERILQHLRSCEQAGINTWQSSVYNLDLYRLHREQGGTLQFITLGGETEDCDKQLAEARDAHVLGVAHHGELTDMNFKSGQFEKVREFCRRVRDQGLMVGVSTHMPDALQRILEEGWDVDFFMCCVYERNRTHDELQKLLGHGPIPVSEVYLESDPPRMFNVMRQTPKPCLAFKILAAGRLCDQQEAVEEAFRSTLSQIKPTDGIIVGMYPEFEDQVSLNAGYVRKYGG